jgi:hypothetical protein
MGRGGSDRKRQSAARHGAGGGRRPTVSNRDLAKFTAPRPSSPTPRRKPAKSARPARRPTSPAPLLDADLVALFLGMLGLGSFFVLPIRLALLTLGLALGAVSFRLRSRTRVGAIVGALGMLAASLCVWVLSGSTAADEGKAIAKTRLAIVARVNELREHKGLEALNFDPSLSIFAQQQAEYASASHTGQATEPTAGTSPTRQTNVWAEMAGRSCSWQQLFATDHLGGKPRHLSRGQAELGFIYGGFGVGSHRPLPVLEPYFNSIGVGVTFSPGRVNVQIDLTGRPQPNRPWDRYIPNLLGFVKSAPSCST